MRHKLILIVATALLSVLPLAAQSGKLYTRKAKLADFSTKITKVVLSGDTMTDAVLREEISLRWQISPYEFCSVADYEAQKYGCANYFLHFVIKGDVIFLSLDKGGKPDDADALKRSFEVVSIPVSGADCPVMDNLCYMAAFIDILQQFTSEAIESDGTAYSGLAIYNIGNFKGLTAVVDPEEARKSFLAGEQDTMVGILVAADNPKEDSFCYKMLVTCDTHRLCHIKKSKAGAGKGWSKAELKRFNGLSVQ